MRDSYTPDEAREIDRNYRIVSDAINRLHPDLGRELNRAYLAVAREVGAPALARVLVTSELMRGINRDERRPISTQAFMISPGLRSGLEIAHKVGGAIAPFALRDMRGFLRRHFGRRPPVLGQSAKEAILRCQMVHASSGQSAKRLAYAEIADGRAKARLSR